MVGFASIKMANTVLVEMDLIALWFWTAKYHRTALFANLCFVPKHSRVRVLSCRVAKDRYCRLFVNQYGEHGAVV